MTTIPFYAFQAIRVLPLQFGHYVGNPPRLVTTDLLSGCGSLHLPPILQALMQILRNGTAFIEAIANSVINQINSLVSAITGTIANLAGAITSSIQNLLALIPHVAGGFPNLGTLSSLIAAAQSAISSALGAVSAVIGSVTGAFNAVIGAAMSAVNGMINGITAAINGAVQSLINLATAAALSVVCAAAADLNGFVNKIASPALKAVLPAPI